MRERERERERAGANASQELEDDPGCLERASLNLLDDGVCVDTAILQRQDRGFDFKKTGRLIHTDKDELIIRHANLKLWVFRRPEEKVEERKGQCSKMGDDVRVKRFSNN